MMPVETYASGYYNPRLSEQTLNRRNLLRGNKLSAISDRMPETLSNQFRVTRNIIENIVENIISVVIGLTHLHIVGSKNTASVRLRV